MAALVAITPLAVIVLLMAVLRWSAASAGLVGLVAATVGAIGFFGFGTSVHGEQGIAGALIGTGAEAVFSAVDIVWIILPALSLYELQQRSGAIDAIRTGLISLSSDKTLLAVIIAWFFAPFMEGAAGFGTPIALAAPLLVSLGFTPIVAVALPLIGHVAGVSFGALGTPILAQVDVSGISGDRIAPRRHCCTRAWRPCWCFRLCSSRAQGGSRKNTRRGPSSPPFVFCCLTWGWPYG